MTFLENGSKVHKRDETGNGARFGTGLSVWDDSSESKLLSMGLELDKSHRG